MVLTFLITVFWFHVSRHFSTNIYSLWETWFHRKKETLHLSWILTFILQLIKIENSFHSWMMWKQGNSGIAEVFISPNFWHLRGNMKVINLNIFEKRHYMKTSQIFQGLSVGAWESSPLLLIQVAKLIWLSSSGQQSLHMAITWYLPLRLHLIPTVYPGLNWANFQQKPPVTPEASLSPCHADCLQQQPAWAVRAVCQWNLHNA